ncbi:hypothetical protein OIV83_003996 [Microbotryomycetes sp. JL201]|nr:hypothetical protein OIV83_003996 [Microbotryomycetes sp. JL201]
MDPFDAIQLIRRPTPPPREPPKREFHAPLRTSSAADLEQPLEPELDPTNQFNHLSFFASPEPLYIIHILPRPRPPPSSSTSPESDDANSINANRLLPLNVKLRLKTPFEKVFSAYTYKVNSSTTTMTTTTTTTATPSGDQQSQRQRQEPLTADMLEFSLRTFQNPDDGLPLQGNECLGDFLVQAIDIVSPGGQKAVAATTTGNEMMLLVWVSLKEADAREYTTTTTKPPTTTTTKKDSLVGKPVRNGRSRKG